MHLTCFFDIKYNFLYMLTNLFLNNFPRSDSNLNVFSKIDASPSLNPENERNILKREKSVSIQQNFSVIITQYAFANRNTTTDSHFRCTVPKHYHKISEIANYLDMVVTLIIPFILITYFNVRIAISVWNLKEQRQQIVASPSVPQKPKTLVVEIAETLHSTSCKSPATTLTSNHVHQFVDDLEHKECPLYTDDNHHAQLSVRFQNEFPSHDAHCSTSFQEYESQSRLTVIKSINIYIWQSFLIKWLCILGFPAYLTFDVMK